MSQADFQTLSGSQDCHATVHSSWLNIQSPSHWGPDLFLAWSSIIAKACFHHFRICCVFPIVREVISYLSTLSPIITSS